jgi:hypothetical protein
MANAACTFSKQDEHPFNCRKCQQSFAAGTPSFNLRDLNNPNAASHVVCKTCYGYYLGKQTTQQNHNGTNSVYSSNISSYICTGSQPEPVHGYGRNEPDPQRHQKQLINSDITASQREGVCHTELGIK